MIGAQSKWYPWACWGLCTWDQSLLCKPSQILPRLSSCFWKLTTIFGRQVSRSDIMRYILSCWQYIVITDVCVLTLTAVDFFNQAHQSSGIEAKLKGAGVQYSTVAPIIPTHPCYCCSVHGVLLHPHHLTAQWWIRLFSPSRGQAGCYKGGEDTVLLLQRWKAQS